MTDIDKGEQFVEVFDFEVNRVVGKMSRVQWTLASGQIHQCLKYCLPVSLAWDKSLLLLGK